jgi:hypothetical protein
VRALVTAFVEHWDAHRAVLRLRDLASEEGYRRFQRVRRQSLAPVLERLAANRVELEPLGVGRDPLIETSARIVHQIVTGERTP